MLRESPLSKGLPDISKYYLKEEGKNIADGMYPEVSGLTIGPYISKGH